MLGAPAAAALANTYFVSNANDSGQGSLRAAIDLANRHPGLNTITTAPGVGSLTVTLQSALPRLGHEVVVDFLEGNPDQPLAINSNGQRDGLVLAPGSDGSTVEGLVVYGATHEGVLVQSSDNGIYYYFSHDDGQHGMVIQSSNNTVRNDTVMTSTGAGIVLEGPSDGTATGNLVAGDTIGTDSGGDGGLGNQGGGVLLLGSTSGNTIGGSAASGAGNVISGNGGGGVIVDGTGNLIVGNTLGLTPSGSSALPNRWGVLVSHSASNDTFTDNAISGNTDGGVQISGSGTLQLQGNDIGINPGGTVGNDGDGVLINGGGTLNLIGGSAAGDGNLIAGNGGYGVLLTGPGTGENTLQGNTIGTTPSSAAATSNVWGVGITNGAVNDTLLANVVSGNARGGVQLNGDGTSDNQLLGNYIGTDAAGDGGLGNGGDGVLINGGASSNTVGGNAANDGNVISENAGEGVNLGGSGTSGDIVAGNLIGTDPSGTVAMPNRDGVVINAGGSNDTLTLNEVSGNTGEGISLNGTGTTGNVVSGNTIGTDPNGDPIGNGGGGVLGTDGASGNTIGGSASGEGNTIAYNPGGGVTLSGSTTTGDSILSNLIFASGPNRSGPGIFLVRGADGAQAPPVITSITTSGMITTISGTAAPNATVQAFGNGNCSDPEGKTLLGTTNADGSGAWTIIPVSSVPSGTGLTAAQTTLDHDSSQFSACVSSP
jgi:hypothetical protein